MRIASLALPGLIAIYRIHDGEPFEVFPTV